MCWLSSCFDGFIETGGSFKPDGQSFQWVRGGGKSVSVEAGTTSLWPPFVRGGWGCLGVAGWYTTGQPCSFILC